MMVFSKTFPRTLKGSSYPIWEEINLSDEEEKAKKENSELMKVSLPSSYFGNIGFNSSFI